MVPRISSCWPAPVPPDGVADAPPLDGPEALEDLQQVLVDAPTAWFRQVLEVMDSSWLQRLAGELDNMLEPAMPGPASPSQPPVSPDQHQLPVQGSAAPLQGSLSPLQGGATPTQGGAPPVQGSAAPLQGVAAPAQSSTPPVQGSAPPVQGSTPPHPNPGLCLAGGPQLAASRVEAAHLAPALHLAGLSGPMVGAADSPGQHPQGIATPPDPGPFPRLTGRSEPAADSSARLGGLQPGQSGQHPGTPAAPDLLADPAGLPASQGLADMASAPWPQRHPGTPADPSDLPSSQGLVDMPSAWLQQLLGDLDPEACLQLLRVCRALRDLVLSHRTLRLTFSLPIPPGHPLPNHTPTDHTLPDHTVTGHTVTDHTLPDHTLTLQEQLQLACRRATRVRLVLAGHWPVPEQNTDTAEALLSSTTAALGHPLTSITSVELSALKLDALVPPWLTTTCPNMTRLKLQCESVTPQGGYDTLPDPTGLSDLTLINPPHMDDQATVTQWQHHLGRLKGLTSLTVEDSYAHSQFTRCCSTVGTQLTQFTLSSNEEVDLQQLVGWWPALRELRVPQMDVGDDVMEVLLSLPSLRVVVCGDFQLQHSYVDRRCAWTELGFRRLEVGSFDRLPLGSVRVLKCLPADRWHRTTFVLPAADVGAVTRAAAAVAGCGGVQQLLGHVWVNNATSNADAACVAALLPMLSTRHQQLTRVTLSHILVTADLLAAMGQHLASPAPNIIEIFRCTLAPGAVRLLLPSLPPVHQLILKAVELSEAGMIEMCTHACRPVRLQFERAKGQVVHVWPVGWEERARAAMAAAGHQHVTFTYAHLWD